MVRLIALLDRRMRDPRRLRKGLRDLLWIGLAYAGAIALLAIAGVGPGMEPWLRIPKESYFAWEIPFTPAVILFGGLLASVVLHLLARGMGGSGSFEDTTALTGTCTALATLFTLIPDLIIALLLIAGVIDARQWMIDIVRPSLTLALIWCYLLLYVAAFVLSFSATARVAHHLRGWRAWAAGTAAFLAYQSLLLVFIR